MLLKITIILSIVISFSFAGAKPIKQVEFVYQTEDGGLKIPCQSKLSNDTGTDWSVKCTNGKIKKEYGVHIYLVTLFNERKNKLIYQVGMTVFDRLSEKTEIRGGHFLFQIKGRNAKGEHLSFSQTLEDGVTELWADIQLL